MRHNHEISRPPRRGARRACAACRQATRELEPTPPERTDIRRSPSDPAHEPVRIERAHGAAVRASIPGMNARVEVQMRTSAKMPNWWCGAG
jgi:hypothetical protein